MLFMLNGTWFVKPFTCLLTGAIAFTLYIAITGLFFLFLLRFSVLTSATFLPIRHCKPCLKCLEYQVCCYDLFNRKAKTVHLHPYTCFLGNATTTKNLQNSDLQVVGISISKNKE